MSGGVDSSVAAALLKRAGFNMTGVFMKFWSAPSKNDLVGNWNRCCSPQAENRARKVAKILKIPFYVFNFEREFKKRIVDYFTRGYQKGVTPNPCVVCNKEIKFGLLLKKALSLGADFIATGHYARRLRKTPNPKFQISNCRLLRAIDKGKDQSYFLWQLNQKQLKHILFPLGNYTKAQVRKLAKKFRLPIFDIPESQEICFVEKTINDFLKRYLKEKPGPIAEPRRRINSLQGRQVRYGVKKIIGHHRGLHFYTIGQRKGIGLAGGPYYVIDKNIKKNVLIVAKNEKDLLKKELLVKDANWISGEAPKLPIKANAKIRYRHKLSSVTIKPFSHRTIKVIFDNFQRAITPGQSVVFYQGQELLGGGIIC